MTAKQMVGRRINFGIASTLIISGCLPIVGSILVRHYLSDWRWIDEPLLSAVETVGAFIALTVAALLLLRTRIEHDTAHFTWMSAAFICMGLLEALHAALNIGGAFVWTRSLATLMGGLLFSLVWMPNHLAKTRLAKAWPALTAVATIIVGLFIAGYSQLLPIMANQGEPTPAAKAITFLGGVYFVMASAFFLVRYRTRGDMDDLLFANQTLLFGGAGMLFADSNMWDASWWSWHVVRLFAYFLVFGQCFSVYYSMQESLRRSKEELQSMTTSISDYLWSAEVDSQGNLQYRYYSPVVEKITGRSPEFYMQGPEQWLSTIHPDDRPRLSKVFEKARAGGLTHEEEEYRVVRPDGEVRWVRDSAKVRRENGGIRIDGVVGDITDRKRAEEQPRQLAAIVESSDDAIVSKTLDGVITSWNGGAERTYGYSAGEMIGRPVSVLIPPDRPDEVLEFLERTRRGETIEHFVTERLHKDGRRIAVSVSIAPVRNAKGEIVGASSIARDITKQRQGEAALRESEERFRHMADSAPVLIWMSGTDKLCTWFNKPWLDFVRRPVEKELGNGWTENVHPDDLDRCLRTYTEHFDARQPFMMDYRLRRYDGEYRWMQDTGIPRFDGTGLFTGYIGSCADITDRKRAEEELQAKSAALQESRASLQTLTGKLISAREEEIKHLARELHDAFGQSLAVLNLQVSELESLLSSGSDPARERLRLLRDGIGSLAQQIQQLSRQLHPAVLRELGLEIAVETECANFSEQEGVPVSFSSENIPEKIPDDIALCLYRLLQEGLQNIRKHAQAKKAEVRLVREEDKILLAVEDSGNGFELKDARRKGGLGLVSMEERVRTAGGSVSISSRLGQGTRIEVRVPVERR